ncbi:hypothetical protein V6N11_028352 [Hibiscus sabdariffa]|uniref:Reverse transcriptase zinc-binding domain-containing protein n=1 Tax=Hibiscus sabdariffa TaxID=183260 RepID=A0ABR2NQA7_9ROSI
MDWAVDDRVIGWTKLLLSYGSREIFLKPVALPQYIITCYLLPQSMLGDMTRTMHRFWWTRRTNKRGWPLCAWDRVCTTKTAGVLGLRNLQSQHTSSRAKYFPLGNVLDAPLMEKSILFHGKVYTEPWRSSKMTFTGNWTLIVVFACL